MRNFKRRSSSAANNREQIQEGYVTARDGTRLYYNDQGSGPAVILCSGLSVSFVYWKYLVQALRTQYRVIQWNYRGHGRSEPPRDYAHADIACLADDLEHLRAYLKIRSFALLGYSVGVQVILEYYRTHPQRVTALIAALGSYERPFDEVFHTSLIRAILPLTYYIARIGSPLMELAWLFLYANPLRINYHLARLMGIAHWTKCSWEDFAPFFEHFKELDMRSYFEIARAAQDHSAADVLPRVRVPTLVIGGKNDVFTPIRVSRHMAKKIPRSQYLEIPDGTHASMLEEPELINARIMELLHEATASRARSHRPTGVSRQRTS